MPSIKISEKHGVNPTVAHCFACGDDHSLNLYGRLPGDKQAPRAIYDGLCKRCEEAQLAGAIFLIEVENGQEGSNPKRTGRMWGVTREAIEQIFDGAETLALLDKGVGYIDVETANLIGLPEPEMAA